MKIKLDELKKAIQWIEVNSKDVVINLYAGEQDKVQLKCIDKYESEVEITLFSDGTAMPKIKKTEFLR